MLNLFSYFPNSPLRTVTVGREIVLPNNVIGHQPQRKGQLITTRSHAKCENIIAHRLAGIVLLRLI